MQPRESLESAATICERSIAVSCRHEFPITCIIRSDLGPIYGPLRGTNSVLRDDANMPARVAVTSLSATNSTSDGELAASWVASLNSEHSRRNCGRTAKRFLEALGAPLRRATVEEVRETLRAAWPPPARC